jgi:hypothetical protein
MLLVVAAGPALAFHSGGAGECEGCHTMHGSRVGSPGPGGATQFRAGPSLLQFADASSTCLYCHEAAGVGRPLSYMVSTASGDQPDGVPPRQLPPGGDFGWLRKSYAWTTGAGVTPRSSPGDRHGHNVVSPEHLYFADEQNERAPGSGYPSAALGCQSCHDPHGRYRRMPDGSIATTGLPILGSGSYATGVGPVPGVGAVGSYRLLGGVGYQPKSLPGRLAFENPPPDAVAPTTYNRSEAVWQTRVAYGRGMSEWCANCHAGILDGSRTTNMKGLDHPAGNGARIRAGIASNYVAYVRTGVLSNTDASRGYLSLVPFEEGTGDYGLLAPHASIADAYLAGPGQNANVSCLTCHRAHASAFDGILRFRAGPEFITVVGAGGAAEWPNPTTHPAEAQGRSAAEAQAAYYDRPANLFSAFQATLCNKCHAKD